MKPKVALLRGLARESGHWDPEFISLMQSQYDLIWLDYPGCGPFLNDSFPKTPDELLLQLNKQIHTTEKIFLVAVSLGGMVALKWAEKFPEKFSGIVLVNSSMADLNPFYQRLKPQAILALLQASTQYNTPAAETRIVNLISNHSEKRAKTIERWIEIAKLRPMSKRNALRQLAMAAKFRSPKAPLKVPMQILVSENDRLASAKCSQQIAVKYAAPIAIHATGGHDLMIDDPQWVSEQIQAFIKRRTTS